MAALRAVKLASRCCPAARHADPFSHMAGVSRCRASRAAAFVGDHPYSRASRAACVVGDYPSRRFMSTDITGDKHTTGLSSYGDDPHTTGASSASPPGAGSGEKEHANPTASTQVNLQTAIELVRQLDLNEEERKVFLNAVDDKFNIYKSPAEVAKAIRRMDLKTIPEMTWILEALYVKCGSWIYLVDHLLKKRGIKEEPEFTMEEYDQSPSEMRTELKMDRLVSAQHVTTKVLMDVSKLLPTVNQKPPVPLFSITIAGRTIDFTGLIWGTWKQ